MSSFILVGAYILRKLADIIAHIYSYFFDASSFPPQVPSLLAGYDNGLLCALNPCAFLSRCRQQCGPIYRVSLGSMRLVIVSSGDAISSVFLASSQLLCLDPLHREVLYIVAGVKTNYAYLHEVMIRDLYPLIDRCLSPRSLGQTTQTFGPMLLSGIKNLTRDHSKSISLMQLTNEPLYTATNLVMFGSTFPTDTYKDFQTLNKSVPYRIGRTLLHYWPSYAARMRLLRSFMDYLQRGEVNDCDDKSACARSMHIFKDNNFQSLEGAQFVLIFLWTIHSNTMVNSFFSLSFLLGDPIGFARVRTEIDSAVQNFGSLEALLQAGPDGLDDPSFKLLTSAIMETMRLTVLQTAMRQANCDFDLKLKDGKMISIKKGEHVLGDVHAVHMDGTVFSDPETFVVDRFAQQPYRRKHLQTDGYPFHALGGGRHACKGRWLAVYGIKVVLIILLHLFDFNPAEENSAGWCLPRVHPRSVAVIHTEDDIFVRLSPRQAEKGL
ncbi:cytochrome P450 [Boletus reticuloceps]|uniref:Cytochrome P450 n=1 Tax=Boletus reticuloceps TaxID=495285 RepID=A0A8I2YNV2_9AGAM|nr:cytochrome P450 [Boletus reticuloceps]